ncbi:hypothetical protein G6O69_06470 [Pseudenhygromyxa sp. WMMC2535]|uniref:hypothetical protein n=1 Tax=Pseudenhygromyxa sp. WMMC2535 TaxID=2712867 RepID=UPI0015568316|nr:hypothetical protein [Pseudenhygromyxa sp. WMMC2535]NVB37469.1 hypothetical protein [Pseudenhygromyxa sp. WMMC2535]
MDRDDVVSALMQILGERWVTSLAMRDPEDHAPYATPLFYALAEPRSIGDHAAPVLIVASDPNSHHGRLTGAGPTPIAASVYLESEAVGELRGAQLRGVLICETLCTPPAREALRARYLERHPIATDTLAGGRHRLYALVLTWAKLTDNRLGFGAHPVVEFTLGWSGAPGLSASPGQ